MRDSYLLEPLRLCRHVSYIRVEVDAISYSSSETIIPRAEGVGRAQVLAIECMVHFMILGIRVASSCPGNSRVCLWESNKLLRCRLSLRNIENSILRFPQASQLLPQLQHERVVLRTSCQNYCNTVPFRFWDHVNFDDGFRSLLQLK